MIGGVHSQYDQIPYPPGGRLPKPENNYNNTEVLPQEWKFWAPHQDPQSGGLASGGGAPKAFGFEGQQVLIVGAPQEWGKQRLHSGRMHTSSHVPQDPGQN